MTISSTTAKVSYAGDGTTTAFAFGYPYQATSHLEVTLVVDSTGVETVKTETTHYTVSAAGASGTVTMLTAPATGETLVIRRKPPITSSLDLVSNDAFPPQTVEDAIDKSRHIEQYLQEQISRAPKFKVSTDMGSVEIDSLTDNAGKYAVVNADEDGLEFATLTSAGTLSDPVPVANGGTGSATAALARVAIGVGGSHVDGSVAAPSIGFVSETTGFYRIGAYSVGLSIGGVNFATYTGNNSATPVTYNLGTANGCTFTIKNTSTGNSGPVLNLYADSSSPAVADQAGGINFVGRDSAANVQTYAAISTGIVDPTSGSEDSAIYFWTAVAGTVGIAFTSAQGLIVGSPTGGDKGAGTVNATAVYDDNSLLTCYVPELVKAGGDVSKIDLEKWDGYVANTEIPAVIKDGVEVGPAKTITRTHEPLRAFLAQHADKIDPKKYTDYWMETGVLPGMPSPQEWMENGPLSTGQMAQRLWQTVELQAAHIKSLMERIEALEAK